MGSDRISRMVVLGGCVTNLSLFEAGKKLNKNVRSNIFRSDQEISKVLKFCFGLENICMLLYTTSDYYGIIAGAKGGGGILAARFILKCVRVKSSKNPF